jgi:hypothetical protein
MPCEGPFGSLDRQLNQRFVGHRAYAASSHQIALIFGELLLDLLLRDPPLDNILPITLQEVIDGLDANSDRAGRLIFVENSGPQISDQAIS